LKNKEIPTKTRIKIIAMHRKIMSNSKFGIGTGIERFEQLKEFKEVLRLNSKNPPLNT